METEESEVVEKAGEEKMVVDNECRQNSPDAPKAFRCELCERTYTIKSSLQRHYRIAHKQHYYMSGSRVKMKCPFPTCSFCCNLRRHLRIHLSKPDTHNITFHCHRRTFKSVEDFEKWKIAEEEKTGALFMKDNHTRKSQNGIFPLYYRCNRLGFYEQCGVDVSGEERTRKKTKKINAACPAAINVIIGKGKVDMIYHKTHVGHDDECQYQGLSKPEKEYITGKLLQGFSFEKIIQDIKNDESLVSQRMKSVRREDLRNIMKSYKVEWNEEYHSDLKNTDDWVEQLKDFPSSPVLVYKPHGLCLQHLNLYKLLKRDFMLGFMTDGQQQVFEILPQSVVGVCCLHDSNSHGFFLVTVFVIDQTRVPFPIAYCFTNRYDEVGMKAFFNAIKNRVGKIVASLLISDCLHECYSAWAHVMEAQPRRAFYFPRLLHHWRKNVSKMCGEYEKKQNVYDALMALSQESDQAQFEHLLETFVDQVECDDDLKEFVSYFKNDFLNEVDVWSACHYASEGLPEVSHLEELEKKLSDVCFHAGLPKGVDLSIRELLLMTHNKVYEHVANVYRGTEFLEQIIMQDHKNNEQLYSCEIEYNSDSGKWKVKMANDDSTYSVQKTDEHPDDKKLYCPLCKAFLDPYFCNCIDFLVECKVCEHVHAVACSSEPECEIISCDESSSAADLRNGDTEVFSCEETVEISHRSISSTADMIVANFEVVL